MSEALPATDALTSDRPAPTRLKVVVVSGPDAGRELLLERGTYRIGTQPDLELVLSDRAVSRTHLLVEVLQDRVKLIDQGSRNGSFFQGVRFSDLEARPGALIRIGHTDLKLVPLHQGAGLPLSTREQFGGLVGKSARMRGVFGLLERISVHTADVLIRGETGSGKELCARAIHDASARARGPFVVCDLSAVAPTLMESDLFGHVKGAFTGAVGSREGAFVRARGGTVFLDEVGELPLETQPRLLRCLESREVKPVGGDAYVALDVRVVAATNRDLEEEVRAGRFRADLYHRLAVLPVELPPLRERPEDIPVLIDTVLRAMGKQPSLVTAETRALFTAYRWPGNVRELRNLVERVVATGSAIGLLGSDADEKDAAPATARASANVPYKEAKEKLVSAFERDYVADLWERSDGNLSKAARTAGLDRVSLRRLLRKHGLYEGADGEP